MGVQVDSDPMDKEMNSKKQEKVSTIRRITEQGADFKSLTEVIEWDWLEEPFRLVVTQTGEEEKNKDYDLAMVLEGKSEKSSVGTKNLPPGIPIINAEENMSEIEDLKIVTKVTARGGEETERERFLFGIPKVAMGDGELIAKELHRQMCELRKTCLELGRTKLLIISSPGRETTYVRKVVEHVFLRIRNRGNMRGGNI